MNIKKFVSLFLAFLLSFSNLTCDKVAATNYRNSFLSYDMTKINEYVRDKWRENISSLIYFENQKLTDYHLGQGIQIFHTDTQESNYFIYPIYNSDDEIEFVFRIADVNGNYSYTMGRLLANEISTIPNCQSDHLLLEDNGNLLVYDGNNIKILYQDPEMKKTDYNQIIKKAKNIYYDNQIKIYKMNTIIDSYSPITTSSGYLGILTIDYLEQQTNYPWCAGYTSACILRFMTKRSNIYANSIANYGHISTSSGIPLSVVQNYASTYCGINVSNYIYGQISQYDLYQFLRNRQPIYQSMSCSSGLHAVVLHGINNNTYYIRNPWYQSSDTYTFGGNYVAHNGTVFSPYRYAIFS